MARFTGTGNVILPGSSARMYDMNIDTTGQLQVTGSGSWIENCRISTTQGVDLTGDNIKFVGNTVDPADEAVCVNVNANECFLSGNWINMAGFFGQAQFGILINSGDRNRVIGNTVVMSATDDAVCIAAIEADGEYEVVQGNTILVRGGTIGILVAGGSGVVDGNTILHTSPASTGSGGYGIALGGFSFGVTVVNNYITDSWYGIGCINSASTGCVIRGNYIYHTSAHGIYIPNDSADFLIEDNLIWEPGDAASNTYDGIHIDTVRAFVTGNRITPDSGDTRSAVNVAGGDCNVVVGNYLGDPSTYQTDALIDAGADTQLTYPNDPTYGDNFTACPPGSP